MNNNRFQSQGSKSPRAPFGGDGARSPRDGAGVEPRRDGARSPRDGAGVEPRRDGARSPRDGAGVEPRRDGARSPRAPFGGDGGGKPRRDAGARRPSAPKTPKMQTTTLWDFPSQHYGEGMQGDADYIGATPSYVIWNLLHRYTKPGAVVVDPMCGSGTTIDVCKDLDRLGKGFDIAPSRPDITKADARHLPLEDASVDFVFVDPPYSTHIEYSGDQQCIGELDARGGGYYEAMEEVIADIYRVLKPGAYFALYVSDSQAKSKSFCPIGFELFLRMSRLFEPVDIVSVTRHNKSLKRNHWHTSAIEGNFFLRGFNYLFIVRKRPLDAGETHKHENVGALSTLFQAAAKAMPGEVVTPEKFGQLLDEEPERLKEQLSKKQQKKMREGYEPRAKTDRGNPPVLGGKRLAPIPQSQKPGKRGKR